MEYIIVGDTKEYKHCLVCTCGTKENAENTLNRMLTNPNENDIKLMKGMTNFRIDSVKDDDCWWNQGSLD